MTRTAFAVALACAACVGCGRHQTKTESCGYQSLGKGWYLRATSSEGCPAARVIFRRYFSTRGCNATAGACSVSGFSCRYDYTDDIERARCSKGDRVIAFRSLP
jgi:hypothetical protein